MLKSRFFIILLCITLVVLFGSSLANAKKQIVIRAGTTDAIDHNVTQMMIRFKELVEERTDGEIKVEVYPSLQLGGTPEQVEAVQLGTQQMFVCTPAWLTRFVPQMSVLSFPFLFESADTANALLNGPIGRELEPYANKAGFTVLGFAHGGFRQITNNKRPITCLEDLKGLKIRLQSDPVQIESMVALGANSVPMDRGEVFSALQQGVIDAQDCFVTSVYTEKLYEIQKYMSDVRIFYDSFGIWGNKRFFDNLSSDHQAIVYQSIKEAMEYQRELAISQEREHGAYLEQKMNVNHVSDEAKAEMVEKTRGVVNKFNNTIGEDLINKVRELANY